MIMIRAQAGALAYLLMAAFCAGCGNIPQERVIYQGATLNGQPVRMVVDTGAPQAGLFLAGVKRLGVRYREFPGYVQLSSTHASLGYTAPLQLKAGGQTLTGPLPVMEWGNERVNEDGVIGWSDLRDNIFVFDGDKHAVTAVAAVPVAAQGWLKLKVRPANVLVLEIPLPGGTGALLVDTGWPGGVALPQERWRYWRAGRPYSRSAPLNITGPSIAETERLEAWADTLSIGPLTLTDVPVREAVEVELDLAPGFAGSLGLYALKRMDFIVDGKNGYAYLRPKPAPGPPYPIRRPSVADNHYVPQDWAVLGEVKLAPGLVGAGPPRRQP